jgi:hypothetical protein
MRFQMTSTAVAEANHAWLDHIILHDLHLVARDSSAIDCRGGRWISLERNRLEGIELIQPLGRASTAGLAPLVFVGADDVLIERNSLVTSGSSRLLTAVGGLQIGGGSERVAIRRNLIQGGNGNGVTLGSITFVSPVAGPRAGNVRRLAIHRGFTVDSNGCLTPDPNPQNPQDPGGNPLTPQSDGDLYDIRIIDNEILNMGESGISTVRFFQAGIIMVFGLDVELNRVLHCVQLELGDNPFDSGLPLGFGGISLIAVERLTVRDCFIERNGVSHIDPICGAYVLMGRGLIFEENQILDNGPLTATSKQPTVGPRGGIYIGLAGTPVSGVENNVEVTGFPATRVSDNTIIAPLGRALWAVAKGLVSVSKNELSSHGIETGAGIMGATVSILNLGFAYEIGEFTNFSSMALNQPKADAFTSTRLTVGGEILFTDNHVVLIPQERRGQFVFSSLDLLSLDDVACEDNQCEARMGLNFLLANAFVLAWSARMNGNRFEEAITPGLSGVTIAVLNCTSMNQGTRCFAVLGAPSVTVNTGNRSFVTFISGITKQPDPCAGFQKRFDAAMARFGFSA